MEELLGILLVGGMLGYVAFIAGKAKLTDKNVSPLRRYVGALLIIFCIAGYAAINTGTSSDCSDADPLYGGCTTTQEYTPTTDARTLAFLKIAGILLIPYTIGFILHDKRKEPPFGSKERLTLDPKLISYPRYFELDDIPIVFKLDKKTEQISAENWAGYEKPVYKVLYEGKEITKDRFDWLAADIQSKAIRSKTKKSEEDLK